MARWTSVRKQLAERDSRFEEDVARERALLDLERKLFDLRRERGISQVELAEAIGASQENVSRIERTDDLRLSTLAGYVAGLFHRRH